MLRREGLCSSHLVTWRQERAAGILRGLTPQKRGPKSRRNPLDDGNQKLHRENQRLTEQLRKPLRRILRRVTKMALAATMANNANEVGSGVVASACNSSSVLSPS